MERGDRCFGTYRNVIQFVTRTPPRLHTLYSLGIQSSSLRTSSDWKHPASIYSTLGLTVNYIPHFSMLYASTKRSSRIL